MTLPGSIVNDEATDAQQSIISPPASIRSTREDDFPNTRSHGRMRDSAQHDAPPVSPSSTPTRSPRVGRAN